MAKTAMTRKEQQRLANATSRAQLRSLAPNLMPGVTPDQLENIICEKCGGAEFSPAHTLKAASIIQTQNGQPTLVQFPLGFRCNACGGLNTLIKESEYNQNKEGQGTAKQEEVKDQA